MDLRESRCSVIRVHSQDLRDWGKTSKIWNRHTWYPAGTRNGDFQNTRLVSPVHQAAWFYVLSHVSLPIQETTYEIKNILFGRLTMKIGLYENHVKSLQMIYQNKWGQSHSLPTKQNPTKPYGSQFVCFIQSFGSISTPDTRC
jgi:hypothetical protein